MIVIWSPASAQITVNGRPPYGVVDWPLPLLLIAPERVPPPRRPWEK